MRHHRILLVNTALIVAIVLVFPYYLVPQWLSAGPAASSLIVLNPSPAISVDPSLAPAPGPSPFDGGALVSPQPSFGPPPSFGPSPSPAPSFPVAAPTRVTIASLGIDLPIIKPAPTETFPFCNVAEYVPNWGLPGGSGITYLYAHARVGMFGPLLFTVQDNGSASLIGLSVLVYTADKTEYRYRIDAVFAHIPQSDWSHASATPAGDLILQTSETSSSSGPKMMVRAVPIGKIANRAAATALTPHPLACT